jgi:hypothetical protein
MTLQPTAPVNAAVLKHIETPGIVVPQMLTEVTADVTRATNNRQKPEVLSRLTTQVRMKVAAIAISPAPVVVPLPPVPQINSRERDASVAWDNVKSTCDRDALALFRARYSDTFFGDLASRRAAEIETGRACAVPQPIAKPEPPPIPPPKLTEDETFVRALQAELKRVGCYSGTIDGNWGSGSRVAFSAFVQHAKLGSAINPAREHLDAAKARNSRLCPLVCDDDEREVDGKCVAKPSELKKTEPDKPVLKKEPEKVISKTPPPSQPSPVRSASATSTCEKKFSNQSSCSQSRDSCPPSGGKVSECNSAFRECMSTGQWVYRRASGVCFDWGARQKY